MSVVSPPSLLLSSAVSPSLPSLAFYRLSTGAPGAPCFSPSCHRLHASSRRSTYKKNSRVANLRRMAILLSSCIFALCSWATLVYWAPPLREAVSLVLILGGSCIVFIHLEEPLSSRRLPKLLARSGPLIPSLSPLLLTGIFLLVDSLSFSGVVMPDTTVLYTANNFTGVSLSLHTLVSSLFHWGKNGFELQSKPETAVLPRQELLLLLQPQLLQHSIFSCVITLLLGRTGEQQLAGLLLTWMAAILRGALLLQLAAATHAQTWQVCKPLVLRVWRDPSLLVEALKNPAAVVQSAWNFSTGTQQRLVLLGLVCCLCCCFLLHLARLFAVSADVFAGRSRSHKTPHDQQQQALQQEQLTQQQQLAQEQHLTQLQQQRSQQQQATLQL